MKNQYRGGTAAKRVGTWTVCKFRGGLGKKEGVDTPMHTIRNNTDQNGGGHLILGA